MKKKKRDWNATVSQTLSEIRNGKKFTGNDGALTNLLKQVVEASLEAELEEHLSESDDNRRNGKSSKRLKTEYGPVEIETTRDRLGSFNPQVVKKRQTTLGEGLDQKIIGLFSLGTSHNDIRRHVEELYGQEISSGTITAVTDKLLPLIEDWRSRPLESRYAFMYLDGIHFKSRNEEGQIIKKVAYTVLGVDMDGEKDILGIYLIEGGESAKMWLQILSDLQQRGVKDILIACIDNLTGFRDAIQSIYPDTDVQLCVIHQIRNSMKYVSWRDMRELAADLKKVYRAPSKPAAEANLDTFEDKWGKKYPSVIKGWRSNWDGLSQYFKYPQKIRKMIYTTNIVEGYHRNVRKRTKTKGGFTSDKSIIKLLYLVQEEMRKKWGKIRGWSQVLQQLEITFEERF